MLTRERVLKILDRVRAIDEKNEMFGAETHQYRLGPAVPEEFVREAEEKCGFTLPEDYRRFITQVGDGGAGPDHGIHPFREFWKRGCFREDRFAEQHRQEYRCSLARPFSVRPMEPEEIGQYGFSPESFREHPEKFFVWEEPEDEDDGRWSTEGFFELGTRGCQWDFGLALNGEHRGRVFTTDNEGGYALDAHSFEEFYSRWLESLADTKAFRERLEFWRGRLRRTRG